MSIDQPCRETNLHIEYTDETLKGFFSFNESIENSSFEITKPWKNQLQMRRRVFE